MHHRWWILFLLFLAAVVNYLDRQSLSVAQPVLKEELHFDNSQYSYALSAFMFAYAIMHPVAGRLIDRVGTRIGLAIAVVWWSVACMMHSFATGIGSLSVYRFVLGMGEAGLLPGTVKTVAEWFPKSERAFAVGMTNVGIGIGSMVAAPLVTWLILRQSWRVAFWVCGAAGFAWILLWLLVYREPDAAAVAEANKHGEPAVAPGVSEAKSEQTTDEFSWIRLVKLPQVWGLMIARFLADPVWYFHLYWLPPYLSEARGFNLKEIGAYAWIPYVAVVVGNLVGGLLPGYLLRSGLSLTWTRKGMAVAAAIVMPVTIMAARVNSPWTAIGLIALAVLLAWIWATTLFTLPADLFPPNLVGSVYGLSGAAGSLGGVVFMPVVGWVVDHFSYSPMFTLVGLLHPTAAIIILLTIPRVRLLDIRMRTS